MTADLFQKTHIPLAIIYIPMLTESWVPSHVQSMFHAHATDTCIDFSSLQQLCDVTKNPDHLYRHLLYANKELKRVECFQGLRLSGKLILLLGTFALRDISRGCHTS